jgi:hypothetical protein
MQGEVGAKPNHNVEHILQGCDRECNFHGGAATPKQRILGAIHRESHILQHSFGLREPFKGRSGIKEENRKGQDLG